MFDHETQGALQTCWSESAALIELPPAFRRRVLFSLLFERWRLSRRVEELEAPEKQAPQARPAHRPRGL